MPRFEMRTGRGTPLDEAASALQKSIRRGQEKEALYWALDLHSKFPLYVWRRLVVIVCEDIGAANPDLITSICLLRGQVEDAYKRNKDYDLCILGYAVLQMARSPKSREADDAVNQVLREMRTGEMDLQIPDYALDMHTERGRRLGRNVVDFWTEGSKLENEAYDSKYVGWDPEGGDGYHDGNGRKARQPSSDGSTSQDTLL